VGTRAIIVNALSDIRLIGDIKAAGPHEEPPAETRIRRTATPTSRLP